MSLKRADLLLEPPHRLGPFRVDLEADHVHLQLLLVGLLEQLVPAALPVPAVVVDEVHSEQRPVRERDEGRQLADDVAGRGVPGVEHAAVHGVLDLEGRHDGARRRHLDLEPPAGGLVDRGHQQLGGVVREDAERPRGLHLPPDRRLGGGRGGRAVRAGEEGDEGNDRCVNAIADLKGTSLRMGHPSVERRPAQRRPVEVFAASEKWRESMQCGCALSIPRIDSKLRLPNRGS